MEMIKKNLLNNVTMDSPWNYAIKDTLGDFSMNRVIKYSQDASTSSV